MGRTILFVSHDLGSISKYCDRVVLLNKGNKVAEGRPKEMVDLYKKILVGQDVSVIEEIEEESDKILQEKEMDYEHNSEVWKKYMLINPICRAMETAEQRLSTSVSLTRKAKLPIQYIKCRILLCE